MTVSEAARTSLWRRLTDATGSAGVESGPSSDRDPSRGGARSPLGEWDGLTQERPTVSIVLPTHTERAHIVDCLDSLEAQDYENVVEIVVADGGSEDGTRELVRRRGGKVRLLEHDGVTAAAGLNAAIRSATGEVIVRADAHTLYRKDYVTRSVQVLTETGADNVGGRMLPVGDTSFARGVAAATSSPLGIGPGRFHYSTERCEVDTVFLGCWRRQTLFELGLFDETELQWGAEDHELNMRLRDRGGRVVLDPSIVSYYFPRSRPMGLARQYYNYGLGKASTLRKHGRLPTWRPLAPLGLVLASIGGLVLGRGWWRISPPALHLVAVGVASTRIAVSRSERTHMVAAAIWISHWSIGCGLIAGMWRIVRGRPFENRPRGHR